MGDGTIVTIRGGNIGAVLIADLNGNDRFDPSDKVCHREEEGGALVCESGPLAYSSVRARLWSLGIDFKPALEKGAKLSLLERFSEVVERIRFGNEEGEVFEALCREAEGMSPEAGISFDRKICARIAREGIRVKADLEMQAAQKAAASPEEPDVFRFEAHLEQAMRYAKKAGASFDSERAARIRETGYANAFEATAAAAEAMATLQAEGFDLEHYLQAEEAMEVVLGDVARAARGAGVAFDEAWAASLRRTRDERTYIGIAELLLAAATNIADIYEERDFFLERGEAGVRFLRDAIDAARKAALRSGLAFEEKMFERIAQLFCREVYEAERLLSETYAERPGSRFLMEVEFFPRARRWAWLAGIAYDEAWEEEVREISRAADTVILHEEP